MTLSRDRLKKALGSTLERTEFGDFGTRYEGKVRDNYSLGDGRRIIVTTDRVSAFDRVFSTIPFKGQVLNRLSVWWFERTRGQVPNHLLAMPDANAVVVRECTPLPVEFVVRGYLTGVTSTSIWTHYAAGERSFCGHALPDGLRKHSALPSPLLTPSTKAAHGAHDVSASRAEILASGCIAESDFDEAASYASALFQYGQAVLRERGLLLVDTKYEFGKTEDGRIVLIDEIHTPDSSRFWFAEGHEERIARGEDPEALDKEYMRRWLVAEGYRGDGAPPAVPDDVRVEAAVRYITAYETICGDTFAPIETPPGERIHNALQSFLKDQARITNR